MAFAERLRERLKELKNRLRRPEPVEEPDWLEPAADVVDVAEEKPEPRRRRLREALEAWFVWRWRVLGVASAVNVVVNLGLVVTLYSNVWYLNLFLFMFFVPNTVMLIHYRRLLKQARER